MRELFQKAKQFLTSSAQRVSNKPEENELPVAFRKLESVSSSLESVSNSLYKLALTGLILIFITVFLAVSYMWMRGYLSNDMYISLVQNILEFMLNFILA